MPKDFEIKWDKQAIRRFEAGIQAKMPTLTVDPKLSVDENVRRNEALLRQAGVHPDSSEIRKWVKQNHPG